ncbi:MAG: T9SS type A sorting domain-containing protein [candidate division WOR-3 bacterium]
MNNLGNISADSLCKYDVVLVDIQAIWSLGFLSTNLQNYVLMGGGYWINQPNQAGNVPTLPAIFSISVSSAWWNCGTSSCQQYTPLAPLHPITSGLNIAETSGDYDIEGSWSNSWSVLIIDPTNGPNDPTLMVGNYGNGRIVYTDHCFSWNCVDPGTNNYLERITKWVASGSCGTFTPLSNDEKAKLPFDKFDIKNGKLIINLINERYLRYEIFSINGSKVEERDIGFMKPGEHEIKLKLKNGLYILKIYFDNTSFTKAFEF